MMEISLCADYAERMRHAIIASFARRRRGANGNEILSWLAIPLELSKRDARLVPCLIFLLDESHFLPPTALSNIISILKGIMLYDEDALGRLLDLEEIRNVAGSRNELRKLAIKMAEAINHPDEKLIGATFDWLYAQTN